jgi:RNA polymerase sigma factor (sigma-70 family)
MNSSAPLRVADQSSAPQPRRTYDESFATAIEYAARHVARDQAAEIAHEVASSLARLPAEQVSPALIYVAVTNRLRDLWRTSQRRSAAEGAYHDDRAGTAPAWAVPGSLLEVDELHERILGAVRAMPPAMREVFLLVREHGLSYKETAARLGIAVGTVHTQLSRANAVLRECVARYNAGLTDSPRGDHTP